MANIRINRNAEGIPTSATIRVFKGRGADGKQLKPWVLNVDLSECRTEKAALKKADSAAAIFEKQCKEGQVADGRKRFEEYALYVIDLKESRETLKRSTIARYKELLGRITPEIGFMKLSEIRPDHLNSLYSKLSAPGSARNGGTLSPKTVTEHHRLCHMIFEQAVKEGLLVTNPADRVTLPKVNKKDVNYYQPETVEKILAALENEPIKWKLFIHLLLVSACRRGEILGLTWGAIDFQNRRIHITQSVLYSPERKGEGKAESGLYVDTPKTKTSVRWITIPQETVDLIMEYKQDEMKQGYNTFDRFRADSFVFTQLDGKSPMHPHSVKCFLERFEKKNDLPHLNAHAFRHTAASMLLFGGADLAGVSKRLGHSKISTTSDIYCHVIEQSDKRNADILENALYSSKTKKA